MKKQQYVIPMVRVVRVATTTHLCIGSPNSDKPTQGLDDDLGPGDDNPGNFSRKRSVWNDEEEEQD